MRRLSRITNTILIISVLPTALFLLGRLFVCDRFIVNGHSMEPTLCTGDAVYVNKLQMGARLYTHFDFTDPQLHSIRLPGFRKIRVNDIAVYNYPEGWEDGKIGFKINYVCCKRCIGCPGDSVSIEKGFYCNSRIQRIFVPEDVQGQLSRMSDEEMKEQHIARLAYHFAQPCRWTIQQFGPLSHCCFR